ncbi:MAG: hypothetical protein LBL69_05225 [Zoogloeaceae bacterium]|jgi:hypothetical protein|nr:hypothetical protein [Zoogloeaceae bacterium]
MSNRKQNLNLTARIGLAALGGYGLALTAAWALAKLPFAAATDAAAFAVMTGFAAQTAAIIWVFAAASVKRAVIGLALPAMLLAGMAVLPGVTR